MTPAPKTEKKVKTKPIKSRSVGPAALRLKDKPKKVQPVKKKKKPHQRSIASLKKEAWRLMSIKIRKQYADQYGWVACYTCQEVKPLKEMQAGHGVAGRGNAILFDTRIIRPQCYGCNIGRGGNYQVFVPKLIRELGQEVYEQIERDSHKPVKRNREYYLELIESLSTKMEKEGV
jgi:hypothetical protein